MTDRRQAALLAILLSLLGLGLWPGATERPQYQDWLALLALFATRFVLLEITRGLTLAVLIAQLTSLVGGRWHSAVLWILLCCGIYLLLRTRVLPAQLFPVDRTSDSEQLLLRTLVLRLSLLVPLLGASAGAVNLHSLGSFASVGYYPTAWLGLWLGMLLLARLPLTPWQRLIGCFPLAAVADCCTGGLVVATMGLSWPGILLLSARLRLRWAWLVACLAAGAGCLLGARWLGPEQWSEAFVLTFVALTLLYSSVSRQLQQGRALSQEAQEWGFESHPSALAPAESLSRLVARMVDGFSPGSWLLVTGRPLLQRLDQPRSPLVKLVGRLLWAKGPPEKAPSVEDDR